MLYIYIYIYILYIFYAKDCVVERDAAAGQPPGQSSHPAARARVLLRNPLPRISDIL